MIGVGSKWVHIFNGYVCDVLDVKAQVFRVEGVPQCDVCVWYRDKHSEIRTTREEHFLRLYKPHEPIYEYQYARIIDGVIFVTPYFMTDCEAKEKGFEEVAKIKISARERQS